MKTVKYIIICLFLLFPFKGAEAQNKLEDYLIKEPACLDIKNEEERTVFGFVETARHPMTGNRHRSEFRLEPGQSAKACTTGPFYRDYRVFFTLKAMSLTMFECYTKINQPLIIKRSKDRLGHYIKDAKGYTVWASCY
ncbi:MAG: hypothetical protein CMH30_00375 [Micavibrio sp.]|nr:hypothetical protein [Micavibrio sp.]|tara:strand:- start:807 stop:1220 length:414 start_codon:yes stop_codon:yes gene_type:complete